MRLTRRSFFGILGGAAAAVLWPRRRAAGEIRVVRPRLGGLVPPADADVGELPTICGSEMTAHNINIRLDLKP